MEALRTIRRLLKLFKLKIVVAKNISVVADIEKWSNSRYFLRCNYHNIMIN
jgi:hypothetical protein